MSTSWAANKLKDLNENDLAFYRDNDIYRETYRLCQTTRKFIDLDVYRSFVFKEVLSQSAGQVFSGFGFANVDALLHLYVDDGGSRIYKNLVSYPPYQVALQDCFPNDPYKQREFSQRIVVADMVGRNLGLAATAAWGTAWATGIGYLGHKLPKTTKYVILPVIFGTAGYWAYHQARRALWGLTKAEEEEALQVLRRHTVDRPKYFEQQFLKLYDATIADFRNKLSQMDPNDPKYSMLKTRIDEMLARRHEILARIEAYDQPAEPKPGQEAGQSGGGPSQPQSAGPAPVEAEEQTALPAETAQPA